MADNDVKELTTNDAPVKARGLEGVIALESELSSIDGQKGELVYRGYDIHDLAEGACFEEVVHLLWNGGLPTQEELDTLRDELRGERALPAPVMDILRNAPDDAHPMAVLRTAVSSLALYDGEADTMNPQANRRKAARILAQIPTIIASFDRLRKGLDPVSPLNDGSMAHNFLYMLNGEEPGEAAERIFDVCLVLHADHGLNASTFTGRVIGSTLSDMYSAVSGSIGALKGPLHGGANREVMRMLLEIDEQGADPAEYVRKKLDDGERVMGFGHRVYKTMDPRAAILRDMVKELSEEEGEMKWYDYSMAILEAMREDKGIDPNVDFFSASTYYQLGLDPDLFTPIFALSRTAGWTAHLLEQWQDNRLIRPRAEYVGAENQTFVPLADR
ncbi:citrate synthase [Salinibacter sp. 10B]|uniref:citrate synthase n=1 Tax=Salinibacter sp. 10B TaxID=1923971 RepID=UPI000D2C881B|nr:citrate synthase [Salinibacter sp. 10B]PQJ34949.1 citrate synthase [Salinibacter sp. 10B]